MFDHLNTAAALFKATPYLGQLVLHNVELSQLAATAIAALPVLHTLHVTAKDTKVLVQQLKTMRNLRHLFIGTRFNEATNNEFIEYLSGPHKCPLVKIKLSTELITTEWGVTILQALRHCAKLEKLTIMGTQIIDDRLESHHCAAVAVLMLECPTLTSVHINRARVGTATLAALVPHDVCPNTRDIKLKQNHLGWIPTGTFADSMGDMLAKLPNLATLHLGINELSPSHAVGLADVFVRHRMTHLTCLTLGSNNISAEGTVAILGALPCSMEELYMHGCEVKNNCMESLERALGRMPRLWGLGLNGNPITNSGVRTLARALRGRGSLRDIGTCNMCVSHAAHTICVHMIPSIFYMQCHVCVQA